MWGGGHGSFNDNGYDCSGAVSYYAARRPDAEDADDLRIARRWGKKKKGKWITVYANSATPTRWSPVSAGTPPAAPVRAGTRASASRAGYKVRHYKGY